MSKHLTGILDRVRQQSGRITAGADPSNLLLASFPPDYAQVLIQSDGVMMPEESLELFGSKQMRKWNDSEWKRQYGTLAEGLLFVAQDAFGDQYGYKETQFIKFFCEGGEIEPLQGASSCMEFLSMWLERDERLKFDWDLFESAKSLGASLKQGNHLAFGLPLVAGGDSSFANLEVEPAHLHLHVLGQISQRNRQLPDRTIIRRFYEA